MRKRLRPSRTSNPVWTLADQRARAEGAGRARVVAFSQFACQSTRRVADVILPIGALPEIDGHRDQSARRDQAVRRRQSCRGGASRLARAACAPGEQGRAAGFDFTVDLRRRCARASRRSPWTVPLSGARVATTGAGLDLVVRRRSTAAMRWCVARALQAHPLSTGPRLMLHRPMRPRQQALPPATWRRWTTAIRTADPAGRRPMPRRPGCVADRNGHGATAAAGGVGPWWRSPAERPQCIDGLVIGPSRARWPAGFRRDRPAG